MANEHEHEPSTEITCCPPMVKDTTCDVLNFSYRLRHNTTVRIRNRVVQVPVEVIIRAKWERCPGPTVIGDLVYTTTLLPGETVRLFTQDRRSRFSFDSESKLSYRHVQMSEERSYMHGIAQSMSDLTVNQNAKDEHHSHGDFEGHADAGLTSPWSGEANAGGSYNASSTNTFATQLKRHAEASHSHTEVATRSASSVSIGEVSSRTHQQGESQEQYESSSRQFSNPNKCHAVTFLFYQINKTQTIKFTVTSIERRVIDPVDNTRISKNLALPPGRVSVIPSAVLATSANRVKTEEGSHASAVAQRAFANEFRSGSANALAATRIVEEAEPFARDIREAALKQVDQQLVTEGLLDKVGGDILPETQSKLSFEKKSSLPTPGVIVKGCMDDCDICEENVAKEIDLDLERKRLENELLKKRIDLLEKSQEYRCCPGEVPVEE